MNFQSFSPVVTVFIALFAINNIAVSLAQAEAVLPNAAQATASTVAPTAGPTPLVAGAPLAPADSADAKSINDWLLRMHEAAKKRSYIGTYVVSAGGVMSSAKIWSACDGDQQAERVETLTGAPRSIIRHNDRVVTFMPEHKLARREKRESLGVFPDLLQSSDGRIADFYKMRPEGVERIAGVEAQVVTLQPKDKLRFGYRVWTEQKRGLVVKLQTLDTNGQVLEQAAFSDLQIDAPVKIDKLVQMMTKVDGYRVQQSVLVKTTASAEGWLIKTPVAGFKPMSCYKRPNPSGAASAGAASAAPAEPLQWIFSDGLASVSIFLEPYDRQRHDKEVGLSMGATQTLTRQLGRYWLTAMGEVPMATLQLFASGLENKK